jgi:hypothetical protein
MCYRQDDTVASCFRDWFFLASYIFDDIVSAMLADAVGGSPLENDSVKLECSTFRQVLIRFRTSSWVMMKERTYRFINVVTKIFSIQFIGTCKWRKEPEIE